MLVWRYFLCLALACAATLRADENWPHWRGPHRNGTTLETSRYSGGPWPAREPLWNAAVGEGASSPLVVENAVFTFGWSEGKNFVRSLASESGKPNWTSQYSSARYGRHATGDEGFYSGPGSTPEFDATTGLLYTLGPDGDLHAWKAATGAQVWQVNLYERYAPAQRPRVGRQGRRDYGYTSSPLVFQNWLLVEVGDDTGTVMAFDKHTGEPRWASEYQGEAGHTGGPVLITVEGVPCAAVLALRDLVVMRLDAGHAGRTIATVPWITDFANNVATPCAVGNRLLVTAGYNHMVTTCLEISLSGAKKIWEAPHYSLVCSPVVHKQKVYLVWQKARCLDLETGNLLWEGGQFGDAGSCVATADDKLIAWGGNGRLALLDLAAGERPAYRELAQTAEMFTSDAWPHITLARGQLYCKSRERHLKCFRLP